MWKEFFQSCEEQKKIARIYLLRYVFLHAQIHFQRKSFPPSKGQQIDLSVVKLKLFLFSN